jgi:hypothetical protein
MVARQGASLQTPWCSWAQLHFEFLDIRKSNRVFRCSINDVEKVQEYIEFSGNQEIQPSSSEFIQNINFLDNTDSELNTYLFMHVLRTVTWNKYIFKLCGYNLMLTNFLKYSKALTFTEITLKSLFPILKQYHITKKNVESMLR